MKRFRCPSCQRTTTLLGSGSTAPKCPTFEPGSWLNGDGPQHPQVKMVEIPAQTAESPPVGEWRVRPLRRAEAGAYYTRDGRFLIARREHDRAWHVMAQSEEDEGFAPASRFASCRVAAFELEQRLRWAAHQETVAARAAAEPIAEVALGEDCPRCGETTPTPCTDPVCPQP